MPEKQEGWFFFLFFSPPPRVLAVQEDMFITALGRPICREKARFTVTPSGELDVRRNSKCT